MHGQRQVIPTASVTKRESLPMALFAFERVDERRRLLPVFNSEQAQQKGNKPKRKRKQVT
jgi:hypothetical protein